jgi:hypothetical protein
MARTSKVGAEAVRCTATQGAQQCVSATHGEFQNHRWGKRGEGSQWNADGTPKTQPGPADSTDEIPTNDPAPGSHHADMLNGAAEAKDAERRAEIAAAVTPAEIAEMEEIRTSHPDILPEGYQPRPNVLAGPPGSRLADVSSFSSTLTLFGVPVELQDELTWAQIAKHALDSMIEEVLRTRQPSDPALVAAAFDAILHVAKARGVA